MKNQKVHFLTMSASIAALYVVLTLLSNALGLASGVIQVRISEALCILPIFTPAAIPGLFIGCLLSNLITGCMPWDILFGALATLLGGIGTYLIRKHKYLAPIPPIIANTLIIPLILQEVYGIEKALPLLMLSVGIGEIISCGIIGTLLLIRLKKHYNILH